LAAHALGLGAVWCGVYPREPRMEGLKRLLGLPESVFAHSLVVLGYPAEEVPAQNRYRPERVRRNHW
jgi:nitroreductase